MAIRRVTESLRGRIAELIAPLRDEEKLPAGFRLVEWETEQGVTLRFKSSNGFFLVELEASDPSRPCFATTQRFNIYYSVLDGRKGPLRNDEIALLNTVEAVVRDAEATLPVVSKAPLAERRIDVREIEVDRALVEENGNGYYLNPYVGCMLGCPFCYAIHRADFSRSLSGLPEMPWGRWVDVKVNLPEILRAELARLRPGIVRISPIVTDPYQPLEKRYRITRGCLNVMRNTSFTPVILTRASLILEDVDILKDCRDAVVGMSVPTDEDPVRAAFEPNTESIETRIATLQKLRQVGFRTFAIVQPMLPMTPARLVELLAPHVETVRIGPLFEKARAEPIHRRLGRKDALDESWEAATFLELKQGFESHGVLVNPSHEPWATFLR